MTLERKIYDDLIQWKKANGTYALLIEGARCVGKTSVVKEFAKKEYKSYILIDFSTPCVADRRLFDYFLYDLDTLFMQLSAIHDTPLYTRDSLIVFDEVQEFPRARECIKRLVKDGRYDYIETGSMISVNENMRDILIPSEEHTIKMHPLDFEEFCWALGDVATIDYIKKCYSKRMPMGEGLHRRAMRLYEEYMIVGGMPRCVAAFASGGKNLEQVEREKELILKLYENDIKKYNPSSRSKVRSLYDKIPTFLSSSDKRVKYKDVAGGACVTRCENSILWLEDSGICNICLGCNDTDLVSPSTVNKKYEKCYMGDTGLLVSLATDILAIPKNKLYNELLSDSLHIENGMFYENAVAQAIKSSGYSLYFYAHYDVKTHRNSAKIDFIIPDKSGLEYKIRPVVLELGQKHSRAEMTWFREKYHDTISYCVFIYPGDLIDDNDTLCIPPYMSFCL